MVPDIYFESNFGKIYESIENGKLSSFEYEDDYGKIKNNFILRNIPNNEKYKDIVTPYGYGGPIIVSEKGNICKLVKNYEKAFFKYSSENNIVSEFVRFHPLVENHIYFNDIYNCEHIRNTVQTKIENNQTFQKQFSKSTRKQIKKLLREGFTYRISEKPENIDSFLEIYYSTMTRNGATEFYYFEEKYFEELLFYYRNNILYIEILNKQNEVVAAGLYLFFKNYLHAHLSGTLSEYIKHSPAYLTKYAAVNWAEQNNISTLFHGGGATNNVDDGIYLFKKKFASNTEDLPFFIGKKIWNTEIYKELIKNIEHKSDYFPLYRQ